MSNEAVEIARLEAERFLQRVRDYQYYVLNSQPTWAPGSKQAGALRRSSMDLTRALAEMRRSQ